MSRKFLARASALSLAVFLAACGGDDSSTPLAGIGSDNPDTSPDTGQDDADTNTPTPTLSITANPAEVTAGNSRRITISAFDTNGEKVTEAADQVVLGSVCANSTDGGIAATFENNNLSISEGSVFTNYTPTEACIGTDTISARWNGNDEVKAELDITVQAAPPSPGLTPTLSITANPSPVIAGNSSQITVSAVDANGNKITGNNQVTLNSVCFASNTATFDSTNLSITEGTVFTNYTPSEACSGTDTISARWNGDDDIKTEVVITVQEPQTPVRTISTLTITANPAEVTAGNSRRITISAFDTNGEKVTEAADQVVLGSVCANSTDGGIAATFENNNLSISEGSVFTNYTPAEACVGTDTISARLNANDEVKAELEITVLEPQRQNLQLGYFDSNGDFIAGKIKANLTALTITSDESEPRKASLEVAVVDTKNSNSLVLDSDNQITFFSACASSGDEWAQITPPTISAEAGTVLAEYTPNERCIGEDTLFARLNDNYEIKADVTFTNTPEVATPAPVLKVGSFDGDNFQLDVIGASNPVLTIPSSGVAETQLRVAVVDQTDTKIIGTSYNVAFTSVCLDAGRATIDDTTGITDSGEVLATYTASAECLGTDTVYAIVDGNNELRASTDLFVSTTSLALGSLDGAGLFDKGVLRTGSSELDYNTNASPETEIRSVVAKVDDQGNFEVLAGAEINLEFFSICSDSNLSTITSSGTTQSGELISTYTADGCVGTDTIYARIAGTTDLASAEITIKAKEGLDLQLGHFDNSGNPFSEGVIGNDRATALLPGAQTKLYVSILDGATDEQVQGQPLTVDFVSLCGEQPGAESPLSTNTSTISLGYTEILYTAKSCGNLTEDTITATLTGAEGLSAKAEAKITLDKAPANSLTAGLPTPNSIAPAFLPTDGRETTSELKFQLKDNDGNGLPNETIAFRLDNPASVDVADLSPVDSGITDADGFATVEIKAIENFDNVVFRVIASYDDGSGNTLEAYSAPIAVNSKLPYADRFSISTSNFAPDTRGIDGVQVPLTLLAADDEGNRIRGNTVVNFRTDIGSIEPECVLDDQGRCSVTWESLGINTNYAEITAYTHGRLADGSTGEIETKVRMLMTTSTGVTVSLNSNTIPATGGEFCAEASVDLGSPSSDYSPPVGTELTFEVTNGTLLPTSSSSYTLGSSSALLDEPYSFTGCTFIEPDPASSELMKLTVTVTTPGGSSDFDRASE
ncbi:hypothetical protein SAMN04488490_2370 [Marinobacter sp. LV10R510-11A]|uniref:hypothetical protein n=1 Tax=Marinobacter sp. LV10R510-11A TaxID=1415568 RepID=UPI000BB70A3A|nr:hypothetical protein [Marinobacter sp. LV10R510-11A]SOB76660.1 hypothetical protein SAMN04488490_2370 [Marinobacter sp. LV10R510-11A]